MRNNSRAFGAAAEEDGVQVGAEDDVVSENDRGNVADKAAEDVHVGDITFSDESCVFDGENCILVKSSCAFQNDDALT